MKHDLALTTARGPVGTWALKQARAAVADLAARMADPDEARRTVAELNDAFLRLQFALVVDDPRLIRAQREAWSARLAAAWAAARAGQGGVAGAVGGLWQRDAPRRGTSPGARG